MFRPNPFPKVDMSFQNYHQQPLIKGKHALARVLSSIELFDSSELVLHGTYAKIDCMLVRA